MRKLLQTPLERGIQHPVASADNRAAQQLFIGFRNQFHGLPGPLRQGRTDAFLLRRVEFPCADYFGSQALFMVGAQLFELLPNL